MMNPLIRKVKVHNQHIPILIFTLIAVLIGVFLAPNYGESWDEDTESWYGKTAIRRAYGYEVELWNEAAGPTGPAFFMVSEIFTLFMEKIFPGVPAMHFRHFGYYITFVLAAIALYYISLKISSRLSALFASLLFFFQPLLFGHAFINPKDIPFLSGAIIVVTLGIYTVDQQKRKLWGDGIGSLEGFRRSWKKRPRKIRVGVIISFCVVIIITLDLLVFHRLFLPAILHVTADAYHDQASAWINQLFDQLAMNRSGIPLESYLWKTTRLYWAARLPLAFCLLAVPCFAIQKRYPDPVSYLLNTYLRDRWLWTAIFLGFVVSIRLIGVFFGLLLSVYVLSVHKKRSIKYLLELWLAAGFSMFIFQPYFWDNTLQRITESLILLKSFFWSGSILYHGSVYCAQDLPISYNPLILLRQISTPVLILSILACIPALISVFQKQSSRSIYLLLMMWLIIPLLAAILLSATMYDNCRHYLFLLPPLFIMTAKAFEWLFSIALPKWMSVLLCTLLILPGLVQIINLHPYEYIYFNKPSGGIQRAFRAEELDYWCTSGKEALEYVNRVAPLNAHIDISFPIRMIEDVARPDLRLHPVRLNHPDSIYAVLCTRTNADLVEFPEVPVEWAVSRDGADLTVIKRIR